MKVKALQNISHKGVPHKVGDVFDMDEANVRAAGDLVEAVKEAVPPKPRGRPKAKAEPDPPPRKRSTWRRPNAD